MIYLKYDIDDTKNEIPDFEVESLARCLLPAIRSYFESPEGQAAFEAWKQAQNWIHKEMALTFDGKSHFHIMQL